MDLSKCLLQIAMGAECSPYCRSDNPCSCFVPAQFYRKECNEFCCLKCVGEQNVTGTKLLQFQLNKALNPKEAQELRYLVYVSDSDGLWIVHLL